MEAQIYRTNSSSYQDSSFFQQEKEKLESIPGIKYIKSLTEIRDDAPFILISNTHTEPSELPQILLDNTILMVHPNSGHDNFPKRFTQEMNFPIVLGNPIRSHAVAEYILSSIFHHFTPIKNHAYWSNNRKWDRKLLKEQKALIIGMGNVGKILYQSLSPLCEQVVAHDPYASETIAHKDVKREWNPDLARDKDVIVIAASLTNSSRGMIDQQFLKNLSAEALIVNAARGEIVNEEHLISWLKKNERSHAYLDVFNEEPFRPGYLQNLPNLNKTSHIAGVYKELNNDIIEFERFIIKEFLESYSENKMEQFKTKYQELLLIEDSVNYL
ncbi:MAG: NAD(P)-dependent oxidoreductase [Bacteriovoracaceae bacterium]